MGGFFQFIGYVWHGITMALSLDPRVFEVVDQYPSSGWVILVIALLGGASLLIGQSVILFVNRVKPGRFAMSLAMNGIIFTIGLVVWALAIWFVGWLLFDTPPTLRVVTRMVGLGAAPYFFGFLVLAPYLGNFIGRVLAIWSFLIVLAGINYLFPHGFWEALILVGLGWLLMMAVSYLVGKPIVAMRNNLWHRIAGSDLDTSVQDILLSFSSQNKGFPTPTDKSSGASGTKA